MPALSTLSRRFGIVTELFRFFWRQRHWWLAPMLVALVLIGVLLAFAHGSAVAPFIYTLF